MEITALDCVGAACLVTFAVISLGVSRLVARGEKTTTKAEQMVRYFRSRFQYLWFYLAHTARLTTWILLQMQFKTFWTNCGRPDMMSEAEAAKRRDEKTREVNKPNHVGPFK